MTDKNKESDQRAMNSKKHPSDLSAVDLIKYLNGRRGWHGNQYRSVCGEWLRKARIRRDALREIASESVLTKPGDDEIKIVGGRV